MQRVAEELKQAETAFVWPDGKDWRIRWFTPTTEVSLCGHATLAAAHVLWESGVWAGQEQAFRSASGPLPVRRTEGLITLDFPAEPGAECLGRGETWEAVCSLLGREPKWFGRNRMDWLAETDRETVLRMKPDMDQISRLGMRGLIVTARGEMNSPYDFVSRFFAPQSGVPEDPVTGSAHCFLGPFWAAKAGKAEFIGYQASPRGGTVNVVCRGERCLLTGSARTIFKGEWTGLPPSE